MIKLKFNSKLDRWPLKRKNGHVYARVIGETIYFGESKEVMLAVRYGKKYVYKNLIRHELEHIYQLRREGWLKYNAKYFYELLRNIIFKRMSLTEAYENVSYEVEARKAGESMELTYKEKSLLESYRV